MCVGCASVAATDDVISNVSKGSGDDDSDSGVMTRACAIAVACLLATPSLWPAAIVAAGNAPLSSPQQDFPPGFRIDRDNWEIPVDPSQTIQIENLHGDVRARRNGVPSLDVFVVIQLQEHDPLKADVRIVETAEGIKVDVRYVPKEGAGEAGGGGEQPETGEQTGAAGEQIVGAGEQGEAAGAEKDREEFIRRVDMVAYIPTGSPLHIHTDDDLIEARRVKSDVVAESTGGDLTIITEGSVHARTSTGSILSVLLLDDPESFSLLETEIGNIVVQVPDDLSIRVRARTSGQINSEYPPAVSDTEDAGTHEALVRVGAGAHEARVESQSGNIDIRAWRRTGQGGDGRSTRGAKR